MRGYIINAKFKPKSVFEQWIACGTSGVPVCRGSASASTALVGALADRSILLTSGSIDGARQHGRISPAATECLARDR